MKNSIIKNTYIIRIILILLLPAGALLSHGASSSPTLVESIYTKRLYRPIGQVLSRLTGFLPFSAAELILIAVFLFFVWRILFVIYAIIRRKPRAFRRAFRFAINCLAFIGAVYFIFQLVWGLNYYRLSFSEIAQLDTKPASTEELKALCLSLVQRTNELRSRINENSHGITEIPGGYGDVFSRAAHGYDKAARLYPELGGLFGSPKAVRLSHAMCYTGITGVYFPFTGEANVNVAIPDFMLPSTASHEMAHQRGFAREDEANYIAYLACTLHPDIDFQYSGVLLALIHSTNALYSYDREAFRDVRSQYSDGVKRDLSALNEFWDQYEGPIEEASSEINNAYLKSNRQEDGVHSYGRMVDLLIAQHRKNMD